jgi:O-antigen ligase
MPVSSLILKQNQEVQIARSNISLSDYDRSKFSMFERAFSISDFDETSNKGRIQIWQETLTSISEHPFLGVGFGNFNYVLGENATALKKGSSAHSVYLDIASEVGVFGLIIFLLILIEILKTSRNLFFKLENKYLKMFAGSFFVYFVWICAYSIFDVVIFNDKVLITTVIIIGTLYSIKKIK